MGKFPIGIQLFSVRDALAADFEGTIKAIAEMGYDGVEFAGLCGKSGKEVKAICDKYGINPISAHVGLYDINPDPEGAIANYADAGVKYIAIPHLGEEFRPGGPKYDEFKKMVVEYSAICKKYGITFLYHNHDFEFQKLDGKYLIDIMYEDLPTGVLDTEFDTCWVNVAGENPSAYITKYAGRTPVVHLKDFVMPGKKPAKMYQLIGIDDGAQDTKEDEAFGFRPCGYGAQNFEAILEASRNSGAKWVIVEQDSPSLGKTPLECAKMSIEYLKTINK